MKKREFKTMDNVVIYARVSSKEQESEGYSIPAQIKFLQEYAVRNSFAVAKEFTDVETAKKAGRTEFMKMLRFLDDNKHIKHVVVEKTDRLLRNISDYALLDCLIEKSDLKIHLAKENVILSRDSRSNEKFVFGIRALMAKNFIDNLSEETKKGMCEKAAQGTWPSFAPYGYLNVEEQGRKAIAIDPAAAPFVRKMFEFYATGNYSLVSLRKKLLADGMVYRNGKHFYTSTLESLLKNEFFTGVFYWKNKKYENASHQPIVDKLLFNKVQSMMKSPHGHKSKKGLFPYINLIRCGTCGCMFTAECQKNKYIYYRCSASKGKCPQPYLKQEVVEGEFERLLENLRITDEVHGMIMQGLRESFKDKVEYHNNCMNQVEKQIKVLQNRIDQAYEDMLDRKISEDFWKERNGKWLEEKEQLVGKLLASHKADTNYMENANLILELAKMASGLFKAQNAEQKQRLIRLVTLNCTCKDGKLELELRKPFDKIMETVKTGSWRPLMDDLRTFPYVGPDAFNIRAVISGVTYGY